MCATWFSRGGHRKGSQTYSLITDETDITLASLSSSNLKSMGKKDVFTAVQLQLHDKEFVPHGLVEEVTARGHRLRRQSLTIYGTTTEHKHRYLGSPSIACLPN